MSYIGNQPTTVAFLTDQFSGNGSTTAFTMSVAPATTSSILVAITGVVQDPSTYSVVGTTLTFSAAPPSGTGNISVRYLGIPASGVITTAYRTVTEFTATASQTTFSVPSYTVGYINVYRNGVRLGTADFTASSGTSVVLATACTAGDLVMTESFYVSSVLNAIPATAGAVNSTYITDGAVTQAKLGSVYQNAGPAFSATQGTGVTVSSGVNTLCTLSTENFDTNSRFNNTGSTVGGIPAYAFLPDVAGYYQVNLSVSGNGTSTTGRVFAWIAKNGSVTYGATTAPQGNANTGIACISTVIYMNGTTDYLQAYGNVEGTGTLSMNSSAANFFSASLVRGA